MNTGWRFVGTRFRAFLAVLEPCAEERLALTAAVRGVADLLGRRFAEPRAGTAAAGHRLVGGLAKGTAITPVAAADLLFPMPARWRPSGSATAACARAALCPLLDEVTALLSRRYGGVGVDRDGWLSVAVGTGPDGSPIGVRVLPAFSLASGGYLAPRERGAAAAAGPWRHLDPEAERRALDAADAVSGGQARALVRLLKAWRRARTVALAPLALELLAAEFVRVWLYPRRSAHFYDWMVRDFFFWLSAQPGRRLLVPGSREALDIGGAWTGEAERAYEAAAAAADLERDNADGRALAGWRAIFGLGFGAGTTPATVQGLPPASAAGIGRARAQGR